jgi:hypothetical protein
MPRRLFFFFVDCRLRTNEYTFDDDVCPLGPGPCPIDVLLYRARQHDAWPRPRHSDDGYCRLAAIFTVFTVYLPL